MWRRQLHHLILKYSKVRPRTLQNSTGPTGSVTVVTYRSTARCEVPKEFEEIGHTGGKVTFNVVTDENGQRAYQIRVQHSSPRPAAWFAIYALPPGVPVGAIKMGGIGVPWDPPPIPGSLPVFIGCDSEGWFGHQCPRCRRYWRAKGALFCCAYCGLRGVGGHTFLTDAQRRYVTAYIERLENALDDLTDGEHVIDMDEVADAVGKEGEKPAFYYSEERQQTKLTCTACSGMADILGRFGYCSSCGTRNDLSEFEGEIEKLRGRVNNGGSCNDAVRDAVAKFDSSAAQYMRELVRQIPLTPTRRSRLNRMRFHDLKGAVDEFKTVFDIELVKGVTVDDIAFAEMMFHRRHVYEHGGGEVDEKYLRDSGDTSVRLKQIISETKESAHRLAGLLVRCVRNLHEGFHSIFPPNAASIEAEAERKRRMESRR